MTGTIDKATFTIEHFVKGSYYRWFADPEFIMLRDVRAYFDKGGMMTKEALDKIERSLHNLMCTETPGSGKFLSTLDAFDFYITANGNGDTDISFKDGSGPQQVKVNPAQQLFAKNSANPEAKYPERYILQQLISNDAPFEIYEAVSGTGRDQEVTALWFNLNKLPGFLASASISAAFDRWTLESPGKWKSSDWGLPLHTLIEKLESTGREQVIRHNCNTRLAVATVGVKQHDNKGAMITFASRAWGPSPAVDFLSDMLNAVNEGKRNDTSRVRPGSGYMG